MEIANSLTMRARQAVETKSRIISKGKELILKHGFEKTSVNMISAEAGITVGTFYYYFKSKEEILLEFLPPAAKMDMLESTSEHSFIVLMRFYEKLVNYHFDGTYDIWQTIMSSYDAVQAIDKKRIPDVASIIEYGQKRGEFSSAFTPDYVANLLVLTNHGLFSNYVSNPDGIEYPAIAMDVIMRIAYSFLTAKGKKALPDEVKPTSKGVFKPFSSEDYNNEVDDDIKMA